MPIRQTITQTRPSTSVAWAQRSTVGKTRYDWATEPGYLDYSQVVSEDNLTRTTTLLFDDLWVQRQDSDFTAEEQAIINSVHEYAVDNGITFIFSIENI